MENKYDLENVLNVLKSYDILNSYTNAESLEITSKKYGKISESSIKEGIAKQYDLKISDVDKILYGRRIDTDDKLNGFQKDQITMIYNDYKDISVSDIAKSFSKLSNKKISADYVYKVLHEKENTGFYVNWRGTPESLKKSKGIENVVENIKSASEKEDISVLAKTTRKSEEKYGFKEGLIATAASFIIGLSTLAYPITKLFNKYVNSNINIQQVKVLENNPSPLVNASSNNSFDNSAHNLVYANLEGITNNKNLDKKRVGLTDAIWVPKAGEDEVMMIKGGEFFPVKDRIDKNGFITLIKGPNVEYWEIPECFK